MNKLEKAFHIIVLSWLVVFLVITKHDISQSADAVWLTLNEYEAMWRASLVIGMLATLSCIHDAFKRFKDKTIRHTWLILLVIFSSVSYPVYLFKHGFRAR